MSDRTETPGFWRRFRRSISRNPDDSSTQQADTEEYVEEITDKLTEQGYLNQEEAGMIRRVVELRDRTAAEIMVPRTAIFAVASTETLDEALHRIQERSHSRIPVYEGTIDNIIGILYTKDLLKLWGKASNNHDHLALLRPPTIIPEGKPVSELLAKFKRERVHIAIVIDEYGGTSGLVTLEDVIEEIFGDIQDEFDRDESLVTPLKDGTLLIDARLPFDRALDVLELSEEPGGERDYDTLGGFLSHLTGRIPRRGEVIHWSGRTFTVESANNRRVFSIRVSAPGTPAESSTAKASAADPRRDRSATE